MVNDKTQLPNPRVPGECRRHFLDDELDELLTSLPAIALEGPKAVGKTTTLMQRAETDYRLDDPAERPIVEADSSRVVQGKLPILIDEWQHLPGTFDRVRSIVDDGAESGSFLLAGSGLPVDGPTHSGAGRIVWVRMRRHSC